MRVNGFPEVAPWGRPDAGVALVDLDNAMLVKGILELQERPGRWIWVCCFWLSRRSCQGNIWTIAVR